MRSITTTDELARYRSALDAIPCAQLDYGEWLRVGMACKAAGLPCEAWDEWCATDRARYTQGKCAEKWDGFSSGGAGDVGAGTLVYIAREYGWDGSTARGYGWNDAVATQDAARRPTTTQAPTLDLDSMPPAGPGDYPTMALEFGPAEQLREFLRYVFLPGELVNVVTEHDRSGQPCGWGITMERDELIDRADEVLRSCDGHTGAWVRINPVCDAVELERMQREREAAGKKRRRAYCDEHIVAWRCALIEADPDNADGMTPDELEAEKRRQLERIYALRLPCAAVVDSGHKSVHAIVRVSADSPEQYRQRVRFLHDFCKANGLCPDPACKNPSRMTRLAGAVRGGSTQRLIDVATGPFVGDEWAEWAEWVERAPRRADAAPPDSTHDAAGDGAQGTVGKPGNRPGGTTQAGLVELMRTDAELRGHFGTNVLNGGLYVTGPLPWDMLGERRRWTDADAEHLFMWCCEHAKTRSRRDVAGAFTIVAAESRFNPIAEMLDALPKWDGTPRADFLLWALVGADDTDYTRAACRTFMRCAVLRGYQPGAKADYTLVLIGPQGCGKSTAVRRMAMRDEFLCESVTDLSDVKLTAEQVAGRWLVELAELEGMTGRRLTAVKQALTMQTATVRLAYAKNPTDLPRSCCFIATTNEGEFLADPSGARRFLPIRCQETAERKGWDEADERELEAFVAQAWAEVRDEYKAALMLPAEQFHDAYRTWLTPDMEAEAEQARDAATMEDTDAGAIAEWLESVALRDGITRVCARQVAEQALGIDMARERGRRTLTTNVARILNTRCPNWHPVGKQRVPGYGTVRAWDYRPPASK